MLLTRDLYANDQVYVILNASNEEHLFFEIEKNKELLRMHYDEQFKKRGNKFIFEDNQIEVEKKLSQSYKWSINVPWGWEVLRDDKKTNFFWMGSEYPYKWISVKWDDGNYIEDELLVGKQVWNYPIDNYIQGFLLKLSNLLNHIHQDTEYFEKLNLKPTQWVE